LDVCSALELQLAEAALRPDIRAMDEPDEVCDICGSTQLFWRNCKLLCRNCNAIVKSCADL
jgi:hypothetical protein